MDPLGPRLERLRAWQNHDGGWGYFPAKQSWLEPTVWAALALAPHPACRPAAWRAWDLVRSWQNPDGGWRPSAAVATSTWSTSLALTLADLLGQDAPAIHRGTTWLAASAGAESSRLNRLLRAFRVSAVERDVAHPGWPWHPGNSSWVEPTAHALVALRKLVYRTPNRTLAARINSGERMLLSVQSSDGGWNYGSPRALGVELPSYAETTALAVLGLSSRAPADAVESARRLAAECASPLARAWLRLALAPHTPAPSPALPPLDNGSDVLITALETVDASLLLPGARLDDRCPEPCLQPVDSSSPEVAVL